MPTDQLVNAAHVLNAVMELDRRGTTKVLSDLESLEPDLLEFLLESLTRLHHRLSHTGVSASETRQIYRAARKTAVICIMALRNGHRDLWDKDPNQSSSKSADGTPGEPPA